MADPKVEYEATDLEGAVRAEFFLFSLCVPPTSLADCLQTGSLSVDDSNHDQAAEKALVWKQDLRIVPLSAFIYLLCYLDRSNIGMVPEKLEGGLVPVESELIMFPSRKCQSAECRCWK